MTRYDRLYDMGAMYFCGKRVMDARMVRSDNEMREPGVEPGYLAVPDPKSERAHSDPEEKPLAGTLASLSATDRHASPANAAQSTTESTTESTTCVRVALSGERRTR